MLAKCFGEFMGTLVLVLLGDGVVANVLLKRSKAEQLDEMSPLRTRSLHNLHTRTPISIK